MIDAQCKSVGVDVPVVAIPLQTGFPAPGSDNCPLDAYPAIPECSVSYSCLPSWARR